MESARRWAPLAVAGVAVTLLIVVVAVALAADQPAAAQPQMVRFVRQFIVFTPKDATIMGIGTDPHMAFPRLANANSDRHVPFGAPGLDGFYLCRTLEEVAPDLGPYDAFKTRNSADVELALTRMDDRWDYHVVTLANSGRVGDMRCAYGTLGPLPVEATNGAEVGPRGGPPETVAFHVFVTVRVGRLPEDGTALVQQTYLIDTISSIHDWELSTYSTGGGRLQAKLGGCIPRGGTSAGVHTVVAADGTKFPSAVHPGFFEVETVDLGEWKTGS